MASIIDYLAWRGDITYDQVPMTNADYGIFGCMSYFPFDGIVPPCFKEERSLNLAERLGISTSAERLTGRKAADRKQKEQAPDGKMSDGKQPEGQATGPVELGEALRRLLIAAGPEGDGRKLQMKEDELLIPALMDSYRFSTLKIAGYTTLYDEEKEEQFGAFTVILPHNKFVVVFRGTDRTLIGWKEDFNMGFRDELPSQLDAVEYLNRAAANIKGEIYVCGHSKGGNLAMYAAVFCKPEVQARIKDVVSLDGPGFMENVLAKMDLSVVGRRMRAFVPQNSVVGMLLGHPEKHTVIHSRAALLSQHHIYTWDVMGASFVPEDALKNGSVVFDAALKDWVANMTNEQREKLIEGIFEAVKASKAQTLNELLTAKNMVEIIKALGNMDEETRALVKEAWKLFSAAMKKSMPSIGFGQKQTEPTAKGET